MDEIPLKNIIIDPKYIQADFLKDEEEYSEHSTPWHESDSLVISKGEPFHLEDRQRVVSIDYLIEPDLVRVSMRAIYEESNKEVNTEVYIKREGVKKMTYWNEKSR